MAARVRLTAAQFRQPATRVARLVARARLRAVRAAYAQYVAGDPEGLHDLRVALRRLRSWVRSFRPQLDDTLRAGTRRRLRDVARATNAARDAEVVAGWVAAQADLTRDARRGQRHLAAITEATRVQARRSASRELDDRLPGTLDRVAADLATPRAAARRAKRTRDRDMGKAMGTLLGAQARRLVRLLKAITSLGDVTVIHRARVEGKRLRYLLETLERVPGAAALTAQVTRLQDLLGECHDADVFVKSLVRDLERSAALEAREHALHAIGETQVAPERRPPLRSIRSGLEELMRRRHSQAVASFETFRDSWGPDALDALLASIREVAGVMRVTDGSASPPELTSRVWREPRSTG